MGPVSEHVVTARGNLWLFPEELGLVFYRGGGKAGEIGEAL